MEAVSFLFSTLSLCKHTLAKHHHDCIVSCIKISLLCAGQERQWSSEQESEGGGENGMEGMDRMGERDHEGERRA